MNDYVVVNFSGGKDSTAMLLMMMEAPDRVLEVTLRKMIIHAASMLKELQEEAKQWLLTRGHDLGIV